MPIMMLMEWEGVTAAQYDEIKKVSNFEGDKPKGAMFHVVAITPKGIRVTDVWEKAEDFQSFVKTRLMPAVQKAGIKTEPRVEIHPAHNVFAAAYKKI
jgi:hypothetical protein